MSETTSLPSPDSRKLPSHARALTKSSVVSLVATVVEYAILTVLVHPLDVPAWVSFFSVQFVATIITFLLNKYWVFEAGNHGNIGGQYLKQIVLFGGSLVLNTAIPSLLHYRLGLEEVLSFAISNIIVWLGWNYPGNRYWVFRR